MPSNAPRIVQQLHQDHRNMAELLDVLQEELDRYRKTRSADLDVISRLIDYVLNFPELRHHPREDLIFRHLKQKTPAEAVQAEAILAEHRELGALTRKLSAAMHNLSRDVEMPRPWFESLIESYIQTYRRHMQQEERIYFPLALMCLNLSDWQEIEVEASEPANDPLFGGKTDAEYQALHDRILRLAR